MDRVLRPERFDCDPNSPDASLNWKYWFTTFSNYLESIESLQPDKLKTLLNFISPKIFGYISDCESYEVAVTTLQSLFIRPKNEVFARYTLISCKQEPGQDSTQFLQKLHSLAKDCNFQAVSAEQYKNEYIRDAFVSGLSSHFIRQRLLELPKLDLQQAAATTLTLEMAQSQSASYSSFPAHNACGATVAPEPELSSQPTEGTSVSAISNNTCYFCGNRKHLRINCPAKDAICKNCGKKGHFLKVCRSSSRSKPVASIPETMLSSLVTAAAPSCLRNAITHIYVNNTRLEALIDTGSAESYVSAEVVHKFHWKIFKSKRTISMASTNFSTETLGHCVVSLTFKNSLYHGVKLSILSGLCADVLLGHDFLNLHQKLELSFSGQRPSLSVCSLSPSHIESPPLFQNLLPNCKPICTKSRRHSDIDEEFIRAEVQKLLNDNIIEPSTSPWRAQVLVTTNERHKKRMVVDYSQTINRFTCLDAYPLPRIDQLIEKISRYEVYSTFDLRSAYHQISINKADRPYTAFEAAGGLYQFCRIPFGVTNGVACFQRSIDKLIKDTGLNDTFAYIDNVTVCGVTQADHDRNVKRFLEVVKTYGLTLNDEKSVIGVKRISLLGYTVSKGEIRPDPDRLQPLRDLPVPKDLKTQQRVVGMFAYYSPWISKFSDKIHPLAHNTTFPIPDAIVQCFEALKSEVERAAVVTIDNTKPLVVETDASDIAIAASLSQEGRPVAFFSRSLSASERNQSSVEKEACAIVEAIRKWRHYLLNNHFKLITDQRSVAFMYDIQHRGKIKNDKIQRWRVELSPFSYDIVYRPGSLNQVADTLSRTPCSAMQPHLSLKELHSSLCHPGITRLLHFVRSKNLPFSLSDIKNTTSACKICCELKPRFYQPPSAHLVKATQPFERLSVDFKGPIPSTTRNHYLFTIIDEYSRFPFAFACPDMKSSTIIQCFCQLFSLFGMPAYIHSDRGSSFMSDEVRNFLLSKNIATSRTTPYNPQANGQVERFNGTLWKTITLTLADRGLAVTRWEEVLLDALHSIRSLLCTATNATPHERMFKYERKSTNGVSLPSWLLDASHVLMKRNVRTSKYDPMVEEVELLECNPQYAHVRLPSGREETVSIRQLAPVSNSDSHNPENVSTSQLDSNSPQLTAHPTPEEIPQDNTTLVTDNSTNDIPKDNNPDLCDEHSHPLLIRQQRTRPYLLRNREV